MDTTKHDNRILARVVARELNHEELEAASGGWIRPRSPTPPQPSSTLAYSTTEQPHHPALMGESDDDGGADD